MKRILRSASLILAVIFLVCGSSTLVCAEESITEGGITYAVSGGEAAVVGCEQNVEGALAIPSVIESYPVTAIRDRAFSDRTLISSVAIPESVVTIGEYAFYRCYGLESVTLGFGVESIGAHAFDACSSLSYVFIPTSVLTIGDYAFSMCSALSSVTVSASVSLIGENSFKHADAMEGVYVTDGSYAHTYLASRLVDVELINGDADGDGALTNADISLIVRCLSGYDAEERFDERKIDVYTDGKLSNRDVIFCIQKLAGWR